MADLIQGSRSIKAPEYPFVFSICTLVTRVAEYEEMKASFIEKGFNQESCEYLYIDNTQGCTFDAYAGLNRFLKEAQGAYIIICHQDILIQTDDYQDLIDRITEIEEADPKWGILSNAGAVNFKWIATHLTRGTNGQTIREKRLPLRVKTIDENFIVARNAANLSLSGNLGGFHMYGTDMCIMADILGYNSYVIEFNILHKSDGNADASFYASKKAFKRKYNHALRGRFVSTTITRFYISGNWLAAFVYSLQPVKFFVRQFYKFFRHKKRYVLPIKRK